VQNFNLTDWFTLTFLLTVPGCSLALLIVVQGVKGEFDRIWTRLTGKKPRTRLLTLFLALLFLSVGHWINGSLTLQTAFMIPVNVVWVTLLSGAPFMSQKLKELLQTTTTEKGAS
jgi:ABC-type bacteriocin/lantibiotic exporter with double-glycine peptidase domain